MWLKAKSPIKFLPEGKNAKPELLTEDSPPFEVGDDEGKQLVAGGAAVEVEAKAAAAAVAAAAAAAAAKK